MAWTSLTFAFGSLLTSTKMTQLSDNITALANGDSGAPSIQTAAIAAGVVAQSQLKTTSGAVSAAATTNLTLPGGAYGFYPQIKISGSGTNTWQIGNSNINLTYVTNIYISVAGMNTAYAQQRYVQASPPYKIGGVTWGHFLFLLRNITTGKVISAYEAEDPPWAYNGLLHLPKDDVKKIQEVPHPFVDYITKDPAADGLEIVIVDLSQKNTKKWKADNAKLGKSPLESLSGIITGKGTRRTHKSKGIPTIAGFTDKINIIDA